MSFGLTAAAVAEYAAKPFIQRALSNPRSPQSVLSFWFGLDCMMEEERENTKRILREASFAKKMMPFWFSGHVDYDALCQNYSELIRDAGNGILTSNHTTSNDGVDWDCLDGKVARIILCDQLSRNCFRGSDEAFAYDDVALTLAQEVAAQVLPPESDSDGNSAVSDTADKKKEEEVFGPYLLFCVLPMMHSERLDIHNTALKLIDVAATISPGYDWTGTRQYEISHKNVIERFGRYPHRNAKKGRESTEEEIAWLASDEVPGWAKSQS